MQQRQTSTTNASPPAALVSRIVLLLAAGAFCTAVAARICDPMLPRFAAEFGVGLGTAAVSISGFAVAYGALQLGIGPLGDRFPKYMLVTVAMGLGTAASLLCALAPDMRTLIIGRVLLGGVSGAVTPVAFAWVGDTVPFAQRQPVLARVMSGTLLGMVSGQLVGGAFVDAGGWRWAFVAMAAMFALVGVMMLAVRRRIPPAAAGRALASPATMLRGYLDIARPAWSRRILATVACEGMLMFGTAAFVPTALHDDFGMPLWQASLVAASIGVGGFVYTVLAAKLLARLGSRGLAIAGATTLCTGLALVSLAFAWWMVALGCLAMGLGFYSFHNTLQVHGTQLSQQQRSMGMALFAMSLFVGQSVGVALISALVLRTGYSVAFGGAAVAFAVLAAGFIAALGRRERAH